MTNIDRLEAILRALSSSDKRFVYFGAVAQGTKRPMRHEGSHETTFGIEAAIMHDQTTPVPFGSVTTTVDVLHSNSFNAVPPTHNVCIAALLAVAEKAAAERVAALTGAVGTKGGE